MDIRLLALGISTPITRSRPSASAQRAATTELSLPPEMPTTALQPGPFSRKNRRIHSTQASFTFTASNIPLASFFLIIAKDRVDVERKGEIFVRSPSLRIGCSTGIGIPE